MEVNGVISKLDDVKTSPPEIAPPITVFILSDREDIINYRILQVQ